MDRDVKRTLVIFGAFFFVKWGAIYLFGQAAKKAGEKK